MFFAEWHNIGKKSKIDRNPNDLLQMHFKKSVETSTFKNAVRRRIYSGHSIGKNLKDYITP